MLYLCCIFYFKLSDWTHFQYPTYEIFLILQLILSHLTDFYTYKHGKSQVLSIWIPSWFYKHCKENTLFPCDISLPPKRQHLRLCSRWNIILYVYLISELTYKIILKILKLYYLPFTEERITYTCIRWIIFMVICNTIKKILSTWVWGFLI